MRVKVSILPSTKSKAQGCNETGAAVMPIQTTSENQSLTIYFGNSEESRTLQLADLCATTLALHLSGNKHVEEYYHSVRAQLVNEVLPLFRGAALLSSWPRTKFTNCSND